MLSWRWPRLGYQWGALALWLVGSWLGGLYGMPEKAWQWLPLTLLVPAIGAKVSDPARFAAALCRVQCAGVVAGIGIGIGERTRDLAGTAARHPLGWLEHLAQ